MQRAEYMSERAKVTISVYSKELLIHNTKVITVTLV